MEDFYVDDDDSGGDDLVSLSRRGMNAMNAMNDNLDVLMRAKLSTEELKKKVQIDLNDEKNLDCLEDEDLVQRMAKARAALAANSRSQAGLTPLKALSGADAESRQALSRLMVALKEQKMVIQCACDEIMLQSGNVKKIAGGQPAHGYPSTADAAIPDEVKECLKVLAKKISTVGSDLARLIPAIENYERDLILTRRNYEKVVDGYAQYAEQS